jgi:hypothetical protein
MHELAPGRAGMGRSLNQIYPARFLPIFPPGKIQLRSRAGHAKNKPDDIMISTIGHA